MLLGIEIGGTKLQLGVGSAHSTKLVELKRTRVEGENGAAGIREQIESIAQPLIQKYEIQSVGIGFGGPVDCSTGIVCRSHQIDGWDSFPITSWCRNLLGRPCSVANDCDAAALAEARVGAGRNHHSVFYVTVGTGIGGGHVSGQQLIGSNRPAISEIGHLRPGPDASASENTVEAISSGTGISNLARKWKTEKGYFPETSESELTAEWIAEKSAAGHPQATKVLNRAIDVLGWAIAQMITLNAPERVVVGGGVSLIGEEHFFQPLRGSVDRYVFPPLLDSFEIVPAELGEDVVVIGAMLIAKKDLAPVQNPVSG